MYEIYELNLTMDPVLKARWIAALRSEGYTQGHSTLRMDDHGDLQHYCCLGVLCDVSDEGHWTPIREDDSKLGYKMNDESIHGYGLVLEDTLSNAVLDRWGIPQETANLLMNLNDGERNDFSGDARDMDFFEIADLIESGQFTYEPDNEDDF